MEIKKADIRFFSYSSFCSRTLDGVEHTKVLPWLSVVQATEGSYDIALKGQRPENTGEGGFFIAPSGVQQDIIHHVNKRSGIMRARWLFIDAVLNGSLGFDLMYDLPTVLPDEYRARLNEIFDILFSTEDIFEKNACCYQILCILYRLAKPAPPKADQPMLAAFEYIKTNYRKEITVEEMAKHLNMSKSNFHALFKKHFGLSPISYINRFRISLAEEQLKRTNDKVISIAKSVGIPDTVYFNKLFKKIYHMSPKEYRALQNNS